MKRLSWLCFVDEVFWIAPHTPLWEKYFFGESSHIHEHHKNGKLQAYDLVELAHLKLALIPFYCNFKAYIWFKHKSYSFFRDEQFCCLRDFDPRSFTSLKISCKVHIIFWLNSYEKFEPNHPSYQN
jgi:hypothetical protein